MPTRIYLRQDKQCKHSVRFSVPTNPEGKDIDENGRLLAEPPPVDSVYVSRSLATNATTGVIVTLDVVNPAVAPVNPASRFIAGTVVK
jgi:hypothetical protein